MGSKSRRTKHNRDTRLDRQVQGNGKRKVKEKFMSERQVKKPITALNNFQKQVLNALATKQVIVISAPAGSGKSFLAMTQAIDDYMKQECDRIFLSRPAVGMGNSLGMLKGGIQEKYEPYLMPLISIIKDRYGKGVYESGLHNENIILQPFEYLRGMNIDGWAIVDEAQCCTSQELYSMLTRINENGKLVLLGDRTQSDLKGEDGISWLRNFVNRHNLHGSIAFVEGSSDDIVRSDFVRKVVKARENDTGYYTN